MATRTKITQSIKNKIMVRVRRGLSGRAIAKDLGISRSAVWYHHNKYIQKKYSDKELDKQGCEQC